MCDVCDIVPQNATRSVELMRCGAGSSVSIGQTRSHVLTLLRTADGVRRLL
jgi:hypothetical protein